MPSIRGLLAPTWRDYFLHIVLLAATFVTATIAGTLFPFGPTETLPGIETDPQTTAEWIDFAISLPSRYAELVLSAINGILTSPELLLYGVSFSASLLWILGCHELGHYVACRLYKVDATLPFFIPTPPMIGPAGTFGAFIKIRSALPSRKAVFDVGIAGPVAGFIALIPVAVLGIVTSGAMQSRHYGIEFGKPLLFLIIESMAGIEVEKGIGNPFFFAAWAGLLVTALNLLPAGQLDGGHFVYAWLGERAHRFSGIIAFVLMSVLSVAGWAVYGSPSGFLIAILVGVMMRIRHPQPYDTSPLDTKRKLIALFVIAIFALSFLPFPLQLTL